MPAIQLSGLASGLDWKSLVTQLIQAERAPQTRLRQEQALGTQKGTALESLKTQLTDLQTSMKSLAGDADIFSDRTAKVASSTSTWLASAASGTETGQYRFDVTQLASKAQRVGALDAGSALSASPDVSGLTIGTLPIGTTITAGDFTVNGARITVALTDSLQDVFQQINKRTDGAVTASYDPGTDKVELRSNSEIVLGSANDTSNLLSALHLYNNGTNNVLSPEALGVVSVSAAIANANLKTPVTGVDGSGGGTFAINGVDIAFNVNTDTIQTVMNRINASTAGVTANFDRINDRFTLTNKSTGDVGVSVSEGAGGLLEALGLGGTAALVRGKNAQFSVDGGSTLTSASNTFDATVHGIAGLSVTATTQTAETVNVGGDNSGTRAKIDDFIKKYNAVQSYLAQQTKITVGSDGHVTKAALAGNRDVSDIGKELRSKLFGSVPGLSGTIQRLESIGIDFKSGSSELQIKDSGKLDAALSGQAADVRALFGHATGGLVKRVDDFIKNATGTGGALTVATETLSKQARTLTEQIATMERRLTQQQAQLEQSFIQMEAAQSRIQSQLSALNNSFGGSSSR